MFTALTFNMQNGQIWDEADPESETIDLQQTVDFLLRQDADVILLQEVEQGYEGGAQYEPPPNYHFLKDRLTGYHGLFGYPRPNPLQIPFGLGQAIFPKRLCTISSASNFRRRIFPSSTRASSGLRLTGCFSVHRPRSKESR